MENFETLKMDLIKNLSDIKYKGGDIGDIGNEIGYVIAKYFDENNGLDEFLMGLRHGISLTDGTH